MKYFISFSGKCIAVLALLFFFQINIKAQVLSKPADKFVDMIGACVKVSRNYSQYTNSPDNLNGEQTTINTINNIKIRHLRDGVYGWNGGWKI